MPLALAGRRRAVDAGARQIDVDGDAIAHHGFGTVDQG